MTQQPTQEAARRTTRLSAITTLLTFLLTALHHFYGALRYDTPWRRDVILHPFIALLLCLLFLYFYCQSKRKIFLALYLFVSFVLFGLGVGIFEGFYNHLLKNFFYFAGMHPDTFRALFPAPTYELPNDLFFETTGIGQFLLAIPQLYYLAQTFKTHFTRSRTNKSLL
jgi:hypothetical protein